MDQQILQAVEIALSASSSPTLKSQAIDFVNNVKSTEDGYNSCLNIIASTTTQINDSLKFFIYQVIDENLLKLNELQLFKLNEELFTLLHRFVSSGDEPVFLKNKLAAILGKLFTLVYLSINPNFLKDLHKLISTNTQALDYYTRIIIAIHSEIGDKFISRKEDSLDNITLVKDLIRLNDMQILVNTWSEILSNQDNQDIVLSNTLQIIGQYISWMEISLFIDKNFINLIFNYLNKKEQRNYSCITLAEIISKKMKPINKIQLIEILDLTNIINNSLVNDNDVEFMENVAKLINQIGLELIIALENEKALYNQTNPQLIKIWPLVFNLLSHEFDDVSQQVFPFIQLYLLLAKRVPELNSPELLTTLLNKIVIKMKYDADNDGDEDDEDDDGEFTDMRFRLKTFQDTIAVLNPELYVEAIPIIINDSIFNSDTEVDWRKLELGLFELGNYADSLRNNLISVPKTQISSSEPYMIFKNFLNKLIESDFIINVNHPKIQLKFFELIVKHYNFLNNQENQSVLVNRIIEIFSSPLGLFNESEKVRLRSWYLFFRFVKLVKPVLRNEAFAEGLIIKMQSLMIIKAELPVTDEDEDVVDNGTFNSQKHLFEAVGTLISLLPETIIESKLKLLDLTFQPLFNDLEKCINVGDQANPLVVLQAHHSLTAIGTIASGITYENSIKFLDQFINKINNAAQVVLITLESFPKQESIRESARFAFARFIPILKTRINTHLTKLITLIISANNLKIAELSDFLSFLGQIVHNYKNDDNIYQLLNNLLTPVINKIFEMLNEDEASGEVIPDLIRDKYNLRKSFMNFLNSINLNHASSLLITETNKQKFPEILSALFEYAYDLNEPTVTRLAITQLVNMINIFGDGGKIVDKEDKYSENLPSIDGIDEFFTNRVTQLSFEVPFQKEQFDLKDAQYRIVAQEISLLLKTYHLKKKDYVAYLSTYLINMGLSDSLTSEFVKTLVENDAKTFKKHFILFVTQLKSK